MCYLFNSYNEQARQELISYFFQVRELGCSYMKTLAQIIKLVKVGNSIRTQVPLTISIGQFCLFSTHVKIKYSFLFGGNISQVSNY